MIARTVLILLISTVLTKVEARVGMGEQFFETPGGHTICDCDPYSADQTPILIGYDELKRLKQWYFYKGHIIGYGQGYYFIFEETIKNLQYFKDQKEWRTEIDKQELDPLYARWLDLSDSPDTLLYFLFLSSFIIIPVLLIVLILIIIMTVKKEIIWNRQSWRIAAMLLLPMVLYFGYRLNVNSF